MDSPFSDSESNHWLKKEYPSSILLRIWLGCVEMCTWPRIPRSNSLLQASKYFTTMATALASRGVGLPAAYYFNSVIMSGMGKSNKHLHIICTSLTLHLHTKLTVLNSNMYRLHSSYYASTVYMYRSHSSYYASTVYMYRSHSSYCASTVYM